MQDRIKGLDSGADDYVVKPTDLDELAAQAASAGPTVQGRAGAAPARLEPLCSIRRRERSRVDGQAIDLQPREFTLLQELMLNAGRVLSREQLEERMYRWGEEVESNAVEVHVHHLRRKLGADIVKTIRGVGYMMPRGEHA